MASVDLRDAYYSVPMLDSCMKFLRLSGPKLCMNTHALLQGYVPHIEYLQKS